MNINNLTNEDKVFIRTIFNEMRNNVKGYLEERDFNLSNPQLFTFLSFSSAALAIASDGDVDEKEIGIIEKISKSIDVRSMVQLDLQEMMSVALEPEGTICNEEFNLRAGSEILYLSKNMKTYEDGFIKAIKAMLTFDLNPGRGNSLTASFTKLMDSIIENNASKNKEEEKKKIEQLKQTLGITSN